MRREYADAGPIPDDVAVVEHIDDIETRDDRVPTGNEEFMRHAGVDLRIGRVVVGIEVAGTQAAAVDHVGGEARPVPEIGDAAGSRPHLAVVGVDPVVLDVRQLSRTEKVLIADDVGRPLIGPGPVRVGSETTIGVHGLELDAGVLRLRIVEPVQHQRRAELSIVDQISCRFQIDVDAELEPGHTFCTTPTSYTFARSGTIG